MGLFPQQFIDDLRLQANILTIVQEYVPLRRSGTRYKGLCPFHAEKTPSFQVDPERGFFHCFGCGKGGDVFKFLELHEKLDFPEAVRFLAQKLGVAVPDANRAEEDRQDAGVREAMLKMHELAAAFFRAQLASGAGAKAQQQLKVRSVSPAVIEQLGLGYAPPSRNDLTALLIGQGFSRTAVVQSGLGFERDGGELVDRFRHRLMVPICRESGSVIAFGGRAIESGQVPKYLNSPETPIYSKGRTLYGLNLTKAGVRKTGFAVLVEGYFDFAQVFQSQVAPVVASCGTALTPQQAQLLRRFTKRVVLSYDPDAAGQGAAARSCELLVMQGFEVNIVELEGGDDPDTFIRKHGAERYRERLRGSRPYLEYLLDHAARGLDFRLDEPRRQFLNRMLGVAARIPDAAVRDQFADRIAHKARITEEVVRTEIRKAAAQRKPEMAGLELPSISRLKPAETGLIWGLIHRTHEALEALGALEPGDFEQLAGRDVFELARSLHDRPVERIPTELLQRLSTMSAQFVTGIASEETAPVTGMLECARILKRLRWERERAALQFEIDRLQGLGSSEHGQEIDLLLSQKRDLAQRIEQLT